MLREAQSAPEIIASSLLRDKLIYQDLGARLRALDPSLVATVARGSSDHAANFAAYLIPLCTGCPVASLPPSLISILNAPLRLKNQFVVALSQSGSSPDIIQSVKALRSSGALTAAIVNNVESKLANTAEILLAQHAGLETSVAATKTVLCTLTAIARLTAEWSQDRTLRDGIAELPERLHEAIVAGLHADEALLKNVSHTYVLARGLGMSAAHETALKLKETCGIHAEPFSSAEVLHGPREIVGQNYLVISFAFAGSGAEGVIETTETLKAQGARSIVITSDQTGVANVSGTFVLPMLRDPRLSPIVALGMLYPWLARASKALGRNPDQPVMLKNKVVHTI